jgi:hypothetical protein
MSNTEYEVPRQLDNCSLSEVNSSAVSGLVSELARLSVPSTLIKVIGEHPTANLTSATAIYEVEVRLLFCHEEECGIILPSSYRMQNFVLTSIPS